MCSLFRTFIAPRLFRAVFIALLALCLSGFTECYKEVKEAELPNHIHTVAVPAFQNNALRYKIEGRFTEAVMNEILRHGHGLRVQSEAKGADAVVDGVVKNFYISGVLLDNTGRARIYEVTIQVAVTVRDQIENRVLYDNQNYEFHGEFQFASDPRVFFDEEDPAVLRMARSFAESLVATLIDGFGINK